MTSMDHGGYEEDDFDADVDPATTDAGPVDRSWGDNPYPTSSPDMERDGSYTSSPDGEGQAPGTAETPNSRWEDFEQQLKDRDKLELPEQCTGIGDGGFPPLAWNSIHRRLGILTQLGRPSQMQNRMSLGRRGSVGKNVKMQFGGETP